ncbi:MAG: hypothetical protein V4684_20985 [Pseudomonadota bacterium]
MLLTDHDSQLAAPLARAPSGGFTLDLVFSGLTTVMLTLAVDGFAGGLGAKALLAVALVIAAPLALLAVTLDGAREPRG